MRKFALSCVILGLDAVALYFAPLSNYALLYSYGVLFCSTVAFVIIARGYIRNGLISVAAIIFALGVMEAVSVVVDDRALNLRDPGVIVPRAALGWGPGHPGVFKHKKIDRSGHVVFDVSNTIDENFTRKVDSANAGPAVAFFGDSMTFGEGLEDAETLPQAFADATGRQMRVYNFGMSGFGPQQFLRALETGMYDPLLRDDPKLFVFLTTTWHVERASCRVSWMVLAPAYQLEDNRPVYRGACYQRVSILRDMLRDIIVQSSTYRLFFQHRSPSVYPEDIELYFSIIIRAGQLAREKFGVPTLILFLDGFGKEKLPGYSNEEFVRRLRAGGLTVVHADIDQDAYPNQPLRIPGDGHPTGLANRIRAEMVRQVLAGIDSGPQIDLPGKAEREEPKVSVSPIVRRPP